MNRGVFLVLLAAILCGVVGQFSLKAGAKILGPIGAANLVEKVIAMATQPLIIAGLGLYAISSIGFIVVLSRANISIVSPLLSISYLFTVLGGKIVFNEPLPPLRLVGVGLIMTGVIFVLRGQAGGATGGS
ncbi:MAG: transporter [Tychonema bourrellyi B0820]|uniref:Transporter n=1 Tax=Tychonema bourrellyi FEM_GT703 TaxID=2040638 RepID=A0A2G4EYV7_9CYAN|nr:transporter [Tychonema bourrellyi]MDQ2100087.1 transporter [Tychonema bourrellyi B0820]PHX54691.1 transporter [Tychonema bourrellyi FEM_GT703]